MELVYGAKHIREVGTLSLPRSRVTDLAVRAPGTLTSSGTADSRIMAMRNRMNVIKQCVLRNDHFSPSTLPSKDRENLLTVSAA